MAESLYRRNPLAGVGILQDRSRQLKEKQTVNRKSASMRNPAFVKITGYDKRCGGGGSLQLPLDTKTWEKTYKTGPDSLPLNSKIKPAPDLESVQIEYGGDWGLAQKLSATIKCYKIGDFKAIQKYFLMPGNEVDVTFGYPSSVSWGESQSKTMKGFTVATFNFTAGQDGTWVCSFEAVSASTAIKNLDMQIVVCNGCSGGTGQSGNGGPIKYITGTDSIQHAVKGVAQLIASDAQKNGSTSLDKLQDGEVITSFTNYNPGTKYGKEAAIVVYTGDHIRNWAQRQIAWIVGVVKGMGYGDSEVESANNQVYVSLGYVVHRIIDDQLLRAFGCSVIDNDRDKFNSMKVEFHPKYSKSKVSAGITSGDPLSVLFLGLGNYKNDSDEGKDFDGDCKNLGAVKCVDASGNVRLQNILIHRSAIAAAFSKATSQRESQSDTTDVKNQQDEVVNIINFFDAIAEHISSCTGGAIALRLVEDPDDMKKLIVVDQNYGESDKLQVIVFDPINGDGSTRTCEIQSNVGSQEYRAAMFVGTSKKGDPVAGLRNCGPQLKTQRSSEADKAKTDKDVLIKNPGNLGKNHFHEDEINALKSVMTRLCRNNPKAMQNETIHYPGLSISITIDGVYGIIPGCAISSTQVPSEWRSQLHSYFMVTTVRHQFQGSDWSTSIDGILGYYDNLSPVNL